MTSQTESSIPSTKEHTDISVREAYDSRVLRGEGTSSSSRPNGSIRRVHQIVSMIKIQEHNGLLCNERKKTGSKHTKCIRYVLRSILWAEGIQIHLPHLKRTNKLRHTRL